MDSRKVILLVGALFVAAVTAFFARSLIAGSAAPQAAAAPGVPVPVAPVTGPEVLVATRSLPVGTILDATALKYQPWPQELVDGAYFLKDKTDLQSLLGTVVRNPVTAGQPVTQGALVKPGDRGFLAAALGPGMRAVTIPVQSQNAVAGFVFPGDRIDLILTQSVEGGGDGQPLRAAETFLRNARVLATDQRTDKSVGEDGKTKVENYATVTVEVTPRIAEQISVAQQLGSISLSLRSIADNSGELERAIASGTDPKAGTSNIQLASQPLSGSPTLATGADVSHFARRTVPGKPVGETPAGAAQVAKGPIVRVARGNTVTEVPVGGKN